MTNENEVKQLTDMVASFVDQQYFKTLESYGFITFNK